MLLAVGGENEESVGNCEKYSVTRNRWAVLPHLKTARQSAGTVLLPSLKAFCFCGTRGQEELNLIETLQLEAQAEWKSLPLSDKIVNISQVAVVSL